MRPIEALKIIVLTPFAFWKEILALIINLGLFGLVIWFWVLIIKALIKYVGN